MMLEPETFDLVRKTMDSLMPDSLDPDLLNQETGFGPGSNFVFAHNDPDGLNAGLHHLLLLCWRSNNNGQALGSAVPLHPSVRRVIKVLSEGTAEETLSDLAAQCKVSEAFLSRTFHRQVGVTMTRYRNSLKLARFWELYKDFFLTILQYGVLVFRDTGLDDTRHVEFSKRFGDLDDIKPYLTNGRKAKFPYYELFDAGNLDDEGNPIALDSQRSHYNKVRIPSPVSVLY
jgi:hypothetical protein